MGSRGFVVTAVLTVAGLIITGAAVGEMRHAGPESAIPASWKFRGRIDTPGYAGEAYKGAAKFPYYPSVLVKQNGELLDARKFASEAKQPGLLAVSTDHGYGNHSGIRVYNFSPEHPEDLTLLSTVRNPAEGHHHFETPWLFIRPTDERLCMVAHAMGPWRGRQTSILFSTENGVNWTCEGTAIPAGEDGLTGYARGVVRQDGKQSCLIYVSLNRGGAKGSWRISRDDDGDGLDARMIGDPMGYFDKSNGRGTEPVPQQIIRRGNEFWGLFLRKKTGSHGSSIGDSTLILQRYDQAPAEDFADIFRHVTDPRQVLIKPSDNRYTERGVTSAFAYSYRSKWYMYVVGRQSGRTNRTNHLLLYTPSAADEK